MTFRVLDDEHAFVCHRCGRLDCPRQRYADVLKAKNPPMMRESSEDDAYNSLFLECFDAARGRNRARL